MDLGYSIEQTEISPARRNYQQTFFITERQVAHESAARTKIFMVVKASV